MKQWGIVLALLATIVAGCGGGGSGLAPFASGGGSSSSTPTPRHSPTPTPTASTSPTSSPTSKPTHSPSPTPSPTHSPTPTPSPSSSASPTPTPTPTGEPTPGLPHFGPPTFPAGDGSGRCPAGVTLNAVAATVNMPIYERHYTGAFTTRSNDAKVATAQLFGNQLQITAEKSGSAKVTIEDSFGQTAVCPVQVK
jgi:hypothetical protein